MSEAQSRPARGRTSARGGRGGHGSRGPRSSKHTNGDHTASSAIDTSADQGELGELKKRYTSQLTTLKELFPDWADVDLVLAIEESDGDLQATIEKISEGEHPVRSITHALVAILTTAPPPYPMTSADLSSRQCLPVCRSQESKGPVPLQGEGSKHAR